MTNTGKGELRVMVHGEGCDPDCACTCMNGVDAASDDTPTILGALVLEADECIVSIGEDGTGHIIARSDAIIEKDILIENTAEDCNFNSDWDKGLLVGTYKLRISSWSSGPDMEGDYDCGIDVEQVTPLWTVPAIEN